MPGIPYYDTVSVTIVDDHTVLKNAKKGGQTVAETKDVISADGGTLIETQAVTGMMPRPFEFAKTSSRLVAGPSRSHLLSGEWSFVEGDLTHHEEDATYLVRDKMLTMSDGFGRSFSAKLDGTEAPYKGDPQFTGVSLKLIDSRSIEESDLNAGKV